MALQAKTDANTQMRNIIIAIIIASTILIGSYYYFRPTAPTIGSEKAAVQHVTLYHYFSGALSGGVDETVKIVNDSSSQKNIIANALDHEAFKSLILSNLAKGNPPELFTYWAGTKMEELVVQGYLEPLDDIWQEHSLDPRLSSTLVEAATIYDGRKYFLPLAQHIVVFFYNVAIFEKLNIQPPKHFDELIAATAVLKNHEITPFALGAAERWPAQFWFDYLLLRTAGPEYRQSLMQGDASYLDPEVTRIYELWSELIGQGFFNADVNELDWAAATRQVCTGEAAMTLMGSWAIQELTGDPCNLEEEQEFDFFAFPPINGAVAFTSVGPVDGLVVTKDSVNKEAALQLLPLFLDAAPQRVFSKGSGAFATSLEVHDSTYTPLKQRLFQLIKNSDSWAFNYDLATSTAIADFGMDSFNELLAFPDQHYEILVNLDEQVRKVTTTKVQ